MNAADRQRPPAGELYLDHLAHFVPDLGAAAALARDRSAWSGPLVMIGQPAEEIGRASCRERVCYVV